MPNPFLDPLGTGEGGGGYLPLPPLPLPAPTPLYVPAPPVPTPVAPPPPPRPVAQVPTITAPTFQTIAPSTVVRGSYADAATQLRKARVQASIDSRADLRTLQARLRELMEMQSNAKQLRARQIASHAESVGSVADKDLQQAMKLADQEIKELERRISKARSLEEPASVASSAVENGNRALKNALDFGHRYDTAGEEPVAPFVGTAKESSTAAEWVDQNWRQQKIQVRDSFGVKRLMTAEEIMNDPDIRMSNSQVKALAREKAEAEWDIRHAPAVQRGTPGGPAPGPVAGGVFVEALTAFHQVAQTARTAPTVSDVEDYAVAQETSVPTIEEAEARMPFSPYVSRQAVAFEAGPESVIPSVPSFPGVVQPKVEPSRELMTYAPVPKSAVAEGSIVPEVKAGLDQLTGEIPTFDPNVRLDFRRLYDDPGVRGALNQELLKAMRLADSGGMIFTMAAGPFRGTVIDQVMQSLPPDIAVSYKPQIINAINSLMDKYEKKVAHPRAVITGRFSNPSKPSVGEVVQAGRAMAKAMNDFRGEVLGTVVALEKTKQQVQAVSETAADVYQGAKEKGRQAGAWAAAKLGIKW